jgi:F0F1-type ATP synthase beta subunit
MALNLCRLSTYEDEEISLPCINAIGLLGQKNDELEAQEGKGFVMYKINALLSNSLLRTLDKNSDKVVTINNTNLNNKNNNSNSDGNNTKMEILSIMGSCLSSFIDLHSSDNKDVLNNFTKLNSLDRLGRNLIVFENGFNNIDKSNINNDEEMLIDFDEVILNMKSFLEYKANYCK